MWWQVLNTLGKRSVARRRIDMPVDPAVRTPLQSGCWLFYTSIFPFFTTTGICINASANALRQPFRSPVPAFLED
jgi:hypothetical protein